MVDRNLAVRGVPVPSFLYGTAWKEEATERLVRLALDAGFRGFDTANQRRHYHEAGVGRALRAAFEEGRAAREDIFLQTKFTHLAGQDHRVPYEARAPVSEQVEQSFRSSLEHLKVERLDSYLLHGPSQRRGLHAHDREAWRAMERLQQVGDVRLLGVSNFAPDQLEELVDFARVPPAFVQNRCFARLGWDAPVRALCEEHGLVYQAFSLLTANPQVLKHPGVRAIASRRGQTVPQLIFRFSLELGMIPLTGTTNPSHMREDLEVYDFELEESELETIVRSGLTGEARL